MQRDNSQAFVRYICLVIADDEATEESVRQCLDTALPIYMTRWQGQSYFDAIRKLGPRMIVVLGKEGVVVQQQAKLVATLFAEGDPTVMSGTLSSTDKRCCHFVVHRLGASAQTQIDSIGDVLLLPN